MTRESGRAEVIEKVMLDKILGWLKDRFSNTLWAASGRNTPGKWPYYSVKCCCMSDIEHADRIAEDRC